MLNYTYMRVARAAKPHSTQAHHSNKIDRYLAVLGTYSLFFLAFTPNLLLPIPFMIRHTFFITLVATCLFLAAASLLSSTHSLRIGLIPIFTSIIFPIYAIASLMLRDLPTPADPRYLSGIILVTLAFWISLGTRRCPGGVSAALGAMGAVIAAFGIHGLVVGRITFSSVSFQSIVPVAWDEDSAAAYQGEGMFVGLLASILLSYGLSMRSRLSKMVLLSSVVLCLALLAIIASRASAIAAVIGLSAVLVGRYHVRPVIVIGGVAAVLWLALPVMNSLGSDVPLLLHRLAVLGDAVSDSSQRIFLFNAAISLFLHDSVTFLFGAGMGAFPRWIGAANEIGWYPHNFVLELLAEYGIVGLFLFTLPYLALWRLSVQQRRSHVMTPAQGALYGCTLFLLATFSFQGGLFVIWPAAFCVGAYLSSRIGDAPSVRAGTDAPPLAALRGVRLGYRNRSEQLPGVR